MWKAIRAFIRREVVSWVRKEFTEAKIRKLVEGVLKQKLETKAMVNKLAPRLQDRAAALGYVILPADAKVLLKGTLSDVVEQVL